MRKSVFDIRWRELHEGDLVYMSLWGDVNSRGGAPKRQALVVGIHPGNDLLERITVLCEGQIYQKMPAQLRVVSDGPLDKI